MRKCCGWKQVAQFWHISYSVKCLVCLSVSPILGILKVDVFRDETQTCRFNQSHQTRNSVCSFYDFSCRGDFRCWQLFQGKWLTWPLIRISPLVVLVRTFSPTEKPIYQLNWSCQPVAPFFVTSHLVPCHLTFWIKTTGGSRSFYGPVVGTATKGIHEGRLSSATRSHDGCHLPWTKLAWTKKSRAVGWTFASDEFHDKQISKEFQPLYGWLCHSVINCPCPLEHTNCTCDALENALSVGFQLYAHVIETHLRRNLSQYLYFF